MRISDWSSDVCSSDLLAAIDPNQGRCDASDNSAACLLGEVSDLADGDAVDQLGLADQAVSEQILPRGDTPPQNERRREIGRASCRERVCQYVSISVVAV